MKTLVIYEASGGVAYSLDDFKWVKVALFEDHAQHKLFRSLRKTYFDAVSDMFQRVYTLTARPGSSRYFTVE